MSGTDFVSELWGIFFGASRVESDLFVIVVRVVVSIVTKVTKAKFPFSAFFIKTENSKSALAFNASATIYKLVINYYKYLRPFLLQNIRL